MGCLKTSEWVGGEFRLVSKARLVITAVLVDAATGEVLRDFTLDPASDYQPTGAPKGPKRKKL